jgi:hypothetical protein
MQAMPTALILPARNPSRPELCSPYHVPTQTEIAHTSIVNPYRCVLAQANWREADHVNGDLLYVGSSMRLVNRLQPNLHPMWSMVWRRKERKQIRIAIWAMPYKGMESVEAWLTQTCLPLWSNANTKEKRIWALREPDLILDTNAFYPYHRKALPFDPATSGVYAWLLLPNSGCASTCVMSLLQNSERR